jgi:hypothetical protein
MGLEVSEYVTGLAILLWGLSMRKFLPPEVKARGVHPVGAEPGALGIRMWKCIT